MLFFTQTPYFGISLTILCYMLSNKLYRRTQWVIFHPVLFTIILIISILSFTNIDYSDYYIGAAYIDFWITPATVALAIKLYDEYELFLEYWKEILITIIIGVVFHSLLIIGLGYLFHLTKPLVATLLPKSLTSAIAMDMSNVLGGSTNLTIGIVIITGVLGALIGPGLLKRFGIIHPIAVGIALGTSSHAVGTSRAIQLGKIEGSMSSLALILTGIIMVLLIPLLDTLLSLLF